MVVHIIGGGLSGSEAAWQIANQGFEVVLYEMRKDSEVKTFAHKTNLLSELVCSNSLRCDDSDAHSVGLLHWELRRLDSLIMKAADASYLPGGSALVVDRNLFADYIDHAISTHEKIRLVPEEINDLSTLPANEPIIIATGPLTSEGLSISIKNLISEEYFNFFDAISPIIYADSIDYSVVWAQSRYDKSVVEGEEPAYLNCPMNKEEYHNFINELCNAQFVEFKDWEKDTPYFEGCLPIEVMAQRGVDCLRFGPMKPIGLTNPYNENKPFAVVQLRQENKQKTLYNLVGFQTKLTYSEQKRIFKMIPGLQNIEFARLGGIHRNSFINSPKALDKKLRFVKNPQIQFAGQITGVEGYVESTAMGLWSALCLISEMQGKDIPILSRNTAIGSLLHYITDPSILDEKKSFQPMNVNFGLMDSVQSLDDKGKKVGKKGRKELYCSRAKELFNMWCQDNMQ